MKCTTQQFLTHSQNCATITTVHFVTCSLLEERNLISISSHYLFIPSPKHYITINLPSICINSPILNISYKLNYRICSLYVWLLLIKFSRFIHVVAFIVYSFAFLMNNVPFMVIYFYLFLILLLEDFCFFSLFWLLWIMLQWAYMYKFLCGQIYSNLLSIYLEVDLLGHIVTLCLTFWEIAKLFPKVSAWFYIPIISIWWFQLPHIFSNACYYLFLLLASLVGEKWCYCWFSFS